MTKPFLLLLAGLMAGPALADGHGVTGDAEAGEGGFKACQSCHVVRNADGEALAGRNARTGPNLFGIAGRQAGSVAGFRYSSSLAAAGEGGLIWDEDSFAGFVQDTTGWLREHLGDDSARSKMTYKVRSAEDAANIWAFLYSLAPPNADGSSVYSE